MKTLLRKNLARWLGFPILILCIGYGGIRYSRARFEQENCYRITTPTPSPPNAIYDVVFFNRGCSGLFVHFDSGEFRLRSKNPPYKQKIIFSYTPAGYTEPGSDVPFPPKVEWVGKSHLKISPVIVSSIEYRLNEVDNVKIEYGLKAIEDPGPDDEGSKDLLWGWFGLGWQVIPDTDNAIYSADTQKP